MTAGKREPVRRVEYSDSQLFDLIASKPVLAMSDSDVEVLFWTMHPRFKFFKGLPTDARMLDIGANNGGMHYWKGWAHPVRNDIVLYGVDLQRGELADQYAGWEVVNLDETPPKFEGVAFDAFYATQLIEHLSDLDQLLAYMRDASAPGAQVFFEWPAPRTKDFPSATLLRERGFDIQTFNFFDDSTHVETYELDDVRARLERHGFIVTEAGEIDIGLVAREYMARGRETDNLGWRQTGLWCASGWSNYVFARRSNCTTEPSDKNERDDMTETPSYLPVLNGISNEMRKGRNIYEGYQRGWGLEFGDLKQKCLADPDFQAAHAASRQRSLLLAERTLNLFLIIKYFLPKLERGHIVEYGSYRGGSALFMAALARKFLPGTRVYALDTYAGMPLTDKGIDAHSKGEFIDADVEEIRQIAREEGLDNLECVKGMFEDTAPELLARIQRVALAHIDCDIYSGVKFAYEASKPFMVPGGYYAFDDATVSSCLGATEVVEEFVIGRDGLRSEQIFPHFVFRHPLV
jgi:SAM-dependent methyltransferase